MTVFAFRSTATLAAAVLTVALTGCERKTYEPKPPAATPSGAFGSSATAPQPAPPVATETPASRSGASPGDSRRPAAGPGSAASPAAAPAGSGGAGTLAELGPISGQHDPANMLRVGGVSAPKPVEWTWVKPANAFRTLQYAVPAPGGSGEAGELVVSAFVGSDGGPLQQNIDRWVGSFATEDGQPVTPVLAERTIDGLKVNLVELRGRYRDMAGSTHPGTLQLGAIVHAPGARIFLRLYGPETTIEANRAAWETLLAGLKKDPAAG